MDIHKTVFLDRDRVITEDPPQYVHRIFHLRTIPKSGKAIKLLMITIFYLVSYQINPVQPVVGLTKFNCSTEESYRLLFPSWIIP